MKIKEYLSKVGLLGSIRGKLALYFLLIVIVPFLFIVGMAFQSERSALREQIKSHLTIIADIEKDRINTWLRERVSDVSFISQNRQTSQNFDYIRGAGSPAIYRKTRQYEGIADELNKINSNHGYLEAMVLDDNGRVLVSTIEGQVGGSRAGEGYFKGGLNSAIGGYFIQDVYFDKELGKLAMAFSAPLKDASGAGKAGVAVLIVGMDKSFYPFFEVWPGMGRTGDTLIARVEDGQIVFLTHLRFHPDAPLKFRLPINDKTPKPISLATTGHDGIIEARDYRGVMVLAAYRYIPELKWGMVVKEDHSEAFAAVNDLTHRVALFMLVAVVLVFVTIYLVTTKITSPLMSLDLLTRRITQGDFSVSLPVKRKDEVGRLAGSFNEMAGALMEYRREVDDKGAALEKANRELKSLTESLEAKVKARTQELEDLNRALISMMEDLDERTAALEKSQDELRKFAAELEESRNRVRENLEIVERANVELRRIDRMKDQFLGIMSHELRTPLSLVTGYSSSLLTDGSLNLPTRVEEALEGIFRGAERLKNIVTEMLDISQIDAKGLRLVFAPTSVGKLVNEVLKEFDTFIKERKHEVVVGDFSEVPQISLDKKRIYQVLTNIIGNAIKFTPDGGRIEITPMLYARASEFVKKYARADADYLDIEVRDSGIGIDRDEAERIFEKFYEVGEIDKHATSKYRFLGRGVGLGLPIARGIVEAHGGRLWVESAGYDPDRCPGSSFHMLLPLGAEFRVAAPQERPEGLAEGRHAEEAGAVVAGTEPDAREAAARRPKVLIVEDDRDILNLTTLLLKRDYEVYTCTDGRAGLDMAREVLPELILLDVYMEGMNGYEVCEALKADARTKDIPLAMFTAGVQRWEVDRGFKAGADDYITKPFRPEELRAKVRDLISGLYAKNRVD